MGSAPSFGRRANLQRTEQRPRPQEPDAPAPIAVAALDPARAKPIRVTPADSLSPDIDREIEDWKRARGTPIPWRQLSLMAGLSFSIAWAVLPDTVNDAVGWLLLALSAASVLGGVSPRPRNYFAGAEGAGGGATKDPAGAGNSTGLS